MKIEAVTNFYLSTFSNSQHYVGLYISLMLLVIGCIIAFTEYLDRKRDDLTQRNYKMKRCEQSELLLGKLKTLNEPNETIKDLILTIEQELAEIKIELNKTFIKPIKGMLVLFLMPIVIVSICMLLSFLMPPIVIVAILLFVALIIALMKKHCK